MSAQPSSDGLRAAIAHLRPQLPELLGTDYSVFAAKLEPLLREGSDSQLLALFGDYPLAHERLLQDAFFAQQMEEAETTKGGSFLPDDPFNPASISYFCKFGMHTVAADDVVQRDLEGHAFCPKHDTIMTIA